VLAALDPALFKGCFASCVESLRATEPHVVAFDGKTSRRGPPSNPDRSGRGAGRMLAARIASHSTSYPPLRGLLAASRSGIGSMAPWLSTGQSPALDARPGDGGRQVE
jgi:hypothetical protein